MSNTRLFSFNDFAVTEVPENAAAVTKPLQSLIDMHLVVFRGMRLLASEYSAGNRGRFAGFVKATRWCQGRQRIPMGGVFFLRIRAVPK